MSKYKVKFEGSILLENIDEKDILDKVGNIFLGIVNLVDDIDDGSEILSLDPVRIEEE